MSTQAESIREMQKKSNDEIIKMQQQNQALQKSLAGAKAAAKKAQAAAKAAAKEAQAAAAKGVEVAAAKEAPIAKEAPVAADKPSAPQVDPKETKMLRQQLEGVTGERDALNEEVTKLKAMINTSAEDKAKAAKATAKVAKLMQQTLKSTEEMVKTQRHAPLKAAYTKVLADAVTKLQDVAPELANSLKSNQKNASRGRNLSRVVQLLRSALEDFVDEHGSSSDGGASAAEVEALKQQLELKQEEAESLEKRLATAKKMVGSAGKASTKQLEKEKKQEQKKVKELNVKVKQLQSALEKAKKESGTAAAQKATEAAEKTFNKKLDAQQKQNAKKIEALTAENDAQVKKIEAQSKKLTKELEATNAQLEEVTAEMKKFKKLAAGSKVMEKEIEDLKGKVGELKTAKKQAKDAVEEMTKLNKLYKQEQILRKKYWNMMEDMKGKIRVYCRCRPFAKYEMERGCKKVVSFADDVTIMLKTEKFGDKEYVYDQCFSPESSNEQVFEDTKRLVHSAIDGFNVCVFAYGQTGSGKTYTVVGSSDSPGLIPRGIGEMFSIIKENANSQATVTSYMIELYNDVLVDLFYMARHVGDAKAKKNPPKLDIKKDSKGMVHIQNAVVSCAVRIEFYKCELGDGQF